MKKKLLNNFYAFFATIFVSGIAFKTQAQQKNDKLLWRETEVILTSGDTVRGSSILRFLDDIISIQQPDGTIAVFTAQNVTSFTAKGGEKNYNIIKEYGPEVAFNFEQNYQTFLWNRNRTYSNFKYPTFFVVLFKGKYSLLMKSNKDKQNTKVTVPLPGGGILPVPINYSSYKTQLYLHTPENNIILLRKPKKDLLKYLPNYQNQVKDYAHKNLLSYNNTTELARIIAYVNALNP
jgi:hypothetical protein